MNSNARNGRRFNYLLGLINLAAVFCIVWFLWYVFFHPNAVMKSVFGFSLVWVFLATIVLMIDVADYYPFQARGSNVITRGIILVIVSVLLMLFIQYIIFWRFIGKFGVAYFSPQSIVASGGVGAEPFNAHWRASVAISYFSIGFLWLALFWSLAFGRWPWTDASRGVVAWSRFFAIMFFTVVAYVILFHPVVCYLFYPPQNKAGVEPWWIPFAGTGSASFILGLVLCTIAWIIMSDVLWEGYPWRVLEKSGEGTFAKGLVTFFGTLILGVITFIIVMKIMNIFWGEAFVGGQYTDGPDFRYGEAGVVSGFFMLAAFILKNYFDNFPKVLGLWSRAIIRTAITMAGGVLMYLFFQSAASFIFLGDVLGARASGYNVSLRWAVIFLSIIMIQGEFFQGWPLRRKEGS